MSKNNIAKDATISVEEADVIIAEGSAKFEYLAEKDPTPKQEFYAACVTALTGVKITPKQYQAMISTHRYIQASDLNQARADYRPRTAASVIKASETLLNNAESLIVDNEGAIISKGSTHIPMDLIPADVINNFKITQIEEDEEVSDEDRVDEFMDGDDSLPTVVSASVLPSEEIFAEGADHDGEDLEKMSKADLIEVVIQAEFETYVENDIDDKIDAREKSLKRMKKDDLLSLAQELVAQAVNA